MYTVFLFLAIGLLDRYCITGFSSLFISFQQQQNKKIQSAFFWRHLLFFLFEK